MSRRCIIFHGTGGSPEILWFPWLRDRLTARGYAVECPHYPDLNVEPISSFLPKVLARHTYDAETVLVGHSGGAALLLSVLQSTDVSVARAILVAGYSTPPNASEEPVLQSTYDWEAIRGGTKDHYFINSRQDPYGCDEGQGRAMFDRAGGTLIVRDDGHFGDVDQPYPTFELVDRLIG